MDTWPEWVQWIIYCGITLTVLGFFLNVGSCLFSLLISVITVPVGLLIHATAWIGDKVSQRLGR